MVEFAHVEPLVELHSDGMALSLICKCCTQVEVSDSEEHASLLNKV